MTRQPIAVGFGEARSRPLIASRVLNLYVETPPSNSRAPAYPGGPGAVHYGTPGLKTPIVSATGPVRAARFVTSILNPAGYIYALIGSSLYRIDQAGTTTLCTGAPISPGGTAMMSNNLTQLAVLANTASFVVTSAAPTVVAAVVDGDYPVAGAASIDYIDGFGVWGTAGGSAQFFLSDLFDFTSINALQFATAAAGTGALVRVIVDHRVVWLFCERVTELWINTGAAPFPLERIPGGVMERGCAAVLSAARMAEVGIFWLANDRRIYQTQGYQASAVSTPPIEEAIRTGTVSDAFGLTYTMGGHQFYAITFPSLSRSFVYDITRSVWHERQSTTALPYAPWKVTCTVEAWGKVYAGTSDGQFGELDLDTYSENGSPIRRVLHSTPFYAEGNRAILDIVEIEMELGTGINTGQGSDPQVMLRWSDDGGATWSNERSKSFGPTGQRRKRVRFFNLGLFRQRMLEFSISDPVKVATYGMKYSARQCLS